MEYYTLKIAGITRKLPLISLTAKIKIASFNLLGDRVLVEAIAQLLAKKIKEIKFEYLIGPEVKVVPLLQELSQILKKERYIVCRKKIHGYMVSPLVLKEKSGLVMDGPDAALIQGKKVVILDDVISSGRTMEEVDLLVDKAGGEVVAKVAVLRQEGIDQARDNLIFLADLPIFRT